jgi:monofunctional biosynthetic peptidoglycan transglycosylase
MVSAFQISDCELADCFSFIAGVYKKHRFLSAAGYLAFVLYFSIPSFQIPVMEYNGFRFTSLMDQRAAESGLLFYPRQSWININEVSPGLLRSIVCMEDAEFFRHRGIDWEELNIALKLNKRRGRAIRGGSTITMQLAKNLFLTTQKSVLRKGKEFLITFRMEKEISKKAILENYVNAVEWGDGLFGIKRAAETYFDKEPADLSINESSRLAAVIPSPLVHKPTDNSNYVQRRAGIIRSRMGSVNLSPVL